ncbi:MAG: alpha/beta fold hydrolase [Bacteroidales bacterium]|nr:alpha/beta fold hydrolase [Bacteroidales bacterium]
MKHSFLIITLGFALACCTPMQMDQMEHIDYSVIRQEAAGFSDLHKFDPLLDDFKDFLFFVDKKLTFRVAAISYPSVDPNGNRVEVSGLVYHPINRKSKGVINFSPPAHMDNESGSTDNLYNAGGILVMLGYTVIIPDLIGLGVSKHMQIPFLIAENTGRVVYDMHRATAQYLWDQFRFVFPSQVILMGYSLGGYVALSAQKYFETYHSNNIKVKEVLASSGPFDLTAAFEAFAKTGFSEYPAIPNIILAFKRYYFDDRGLPLDLEQVFKGELLNNYARWYDGSYKSDVIMEMLGANLHAYMHQDFFKPLAQHNEALKSLHPYLKENSLTEGWRPKAPIYMTHAKADTHVPVECSEAAVKKLRQAGAKISYVGYPGDHYTVGYVYFLRTFLRFL